MIKNAPSVIVSTNHLSDSGYFKVSDDDLKFVGADKNKDNSEIRDEEMHIDLNKD